MFTTLTLDHPVPCDRSTFGDPLMGVAKTCEVLLQRGQVGEWGPLQDWPVLAVHVNLMPNGNVLAWDATDHELFGDTTDMRVWTPSTGGFSAAIDVHHMTGSELFCTGFDLLWDGNLLTSGAQPNLHDTGDDRQRNANRFNFRSQTWSRVTDTNSYRYYPSNAVLGNGDMVSFSGTSDTAPIEVFKFDGTWHELTGAPLTQNFNYYAWGQVTADGRLFYPGPDHAMHFFGLTGAGSVENPGNRDALDRNYGSYAMFDVGRFLVMGGVGEVDHGGGTLDGEAVASSTVIDIRGSSPVVSASANMAFPRRQQTATILADGQVLVTGGHYGAVSQGDFVKGQPLSLHSAELWNPTTGTWRTLASQTRERLYHSTGLLLPDGRVLAAGSGSPHDVPQNEQNGQVFSPPYLFNADGSVATRPVITYAPDSLGYGRSFTVSTTGQNIARLHLIKFGSVTHAQNFGQRLVPLSFTGTSGTLTATLPSNPNLAPPGFYMLIGVDGAGVPSVARTVQLQPFATVRFVSRLNAKAIRVSPADQDGATPRVEMWTSDDSLEQDWQMVPTGDGFGYFKLISRANGKLLGVSSQSTADGLSLTTASDANTENQQWRFKQGRDGYLEIRARHSDKLIDVKDRNLADGAVLIQQHDDGGSESQEWQILPVGWVSLMAVESGKALEAANASQAASKTVQNVNQQGLHQIWSFDPTSLGWSRVVARHNGFVLDSKGATTTNGAPIEQRSANGGTNQDWRLIPNDDGSFKIQVRSSKKYLTVKDRSLANGADIVQFDDNGGLPNMLWRVVPAMAGQPSRVSAGGGQLVYHAHVQGTGWQRWVSNNQVAGTVGLSKRMEAVEMRASGIRPDLRVQYRAHVSGIGWQPWVDDGEMSGTVDESRAMEAIELRLAGDSAGCTLKYRAQVAGTGWLPWVGISQTAGTTGENRQMEALQVRLECP